MTLKRVAGTHCVCFAFLLASGSLAVANPVLQAFSFAGTYVGTPSGDLTLEGTTLYGTSPTGGDPNESLTLSGTVYKVSVYGTDFQLLHSFDNHLSFNYPIEPDVLDGVHPQGGMQVGGGYIHGVARSGGYYEGGNEFRVKTDGTGFTALGGYTIASNSSFGYAPNGDLIYGVGTVREGGDNGNGVLLVESLVGPPVFSMPGGAGALDTPVGALVNAGGTLFGMAHDGGDYGNGGLFKIHGDGSGYQVLHSFAGGSDGYSPDSTMTVVGSKVYGTTSSTIFSVNLDGTGYQVLHSGDGGSNITHVGARLYGADGRRVWSMGLDGNNFEILHQGVAGDGFLTTSGLTFVDLTSQGFGTYFYGTAREGLDPGWLYAMPFDVVPIPEPHSIILAALGMVTLAGYGWHVRRRRR